MYTCGRQNQSYFRCPRLTQRLISQNCNPVKCVRFPVILSIFMLSCYVFLLYGHWLNPVNVILRFQTGYNWIKLVELAATPNALPNCDCTGPGFERRFVTRGVGRERLGPGLRVGDRPTPSGAPLYGIRRTRVKVTGWLPYSTHCTFRHFERHYCRDAHIHFKFMRTCVIASETTHDRLYYRPITRWMNSKLPSASLAYMLVRFSLSQ